ncbi:MAG TPA: 2-oxoacid:acceptor oxidoreductase family protein [Atribacteraceae bacterium]|nr:2-oxoacid:acceptor oxidoreductase family protein [Atribacteraceae bacterium]
MNQSLEIRWHGRGGQGVVTASRILADALLAEGKHFQAFPEYFFYWQKKTRRTIK